MVASVKPNPFRIRDHELDSNADRVPLRDLLSIARPTEPRLVAIRQAQVEALVRMVPVTLLGQFVAATLVAASLIGTIPAAQLLIWLGLALGLCVIRGLRAYRLRVDINYARRRPAAVLQWVPKTGRRRAGAFRQQRAQGVHGGGAAGAGLRPG